MFKREEVLSFTWSSWHPCELGQILSLSDHHLDTLGHCLILQQDEQLSQSTRHTNRTLPVTQRFLRTQTLRGGKEEQTEGLKKHWEKD